MRETWRIQAQKRDHSRFLTRTWRESGGPCSTAKARWYKVCIEFVTTVPGPFEPVYSPLSRVLQLLPRSVFRGAFPTQAQPSCPWPVLMCPTLEAPVTSPFWTCPSALSNYLTSLFTGRTSGASSRGTSLSSPWWWLWSTLVRRLIPTWHFLLC